MYRAFVISAVGAIMSAPLNLLAAPAASVQLVSIDNEFSTTTLSQNKLFTPAGNGPFPAVIVMHGSGGLWANDNPGPGIMNDHFEEWGVRFQDAGYVALFIDSYTPRGIVEFASRRPAQDPSVDDAICSTRHVRPTDAYTALHYLQQMPNIIDDRVALMGFSHGAESTLVSITDETIPAMQNQWLVRRLNLDTTVTNVPVDPPYTVPDAQGFRCAVAYYPGCGFFNYFGSASSTAAERYMPHCPTLLMHGSTDPLYIDNLYPNAFTAKSLNHATLINQPPTVYPWDDGMGGNLSGINPIWQVVYPGVGHSFSELEPGDPDHDQKLEAIDDTMQWLGFYLAPLNSSVGAWSELE
jgi:dienelactone hydrolase